MAPARILIVEDEILVAADLEARLEEAGFEPIGIAADTSSALDLAARRPDLALVDIHLRDGATGIEIAQRLTEEFGVPVVFVTANPRMAIEGARLGLGVLSKPCEDDLLQATVAYALGARNGVAVSPPAGLQLLS